jgi:DnaJ-class molecular chaperone
MTVHNFTDLKQHVGHHVVVVTYGPGGDIGSLNVAIECEDCNEVLLDFDREGDPCNTCGGTGKRETTLEDAPTTLVTLGSCPDCE